MSDANVMVQGVTMAADAAENVAETGADVRGDLVARLRGSLTEDALLDRCLDGAADDDRVTGWRNYVWALQQVVDNRDEAVRRQPARHANGDVAYVEATETLLIDSDARSLSSTLLAQRVTESLDASAAEFAAESRQ